MVKICEKIADNSAVFLFVSLTRKVSDGMIYVAERRQ